MDKQGNEVAIYSSHEVSKLEILGDSPQDLSWAQSAPEKYLAAKALQSTPQWSLVIDHKDEIKAI